LGRLAEAVCDRHFGAGADGMIVADAGAEVAGATWTSRIFNADGGEAEVSGNGTRCLAAYVDATERWPADGGALRISTAAGIKLVGRAGAEGHYEREMGVPRFASADVPMVLDPPRDRVVGYPLEVDGARYAVTALSVGNPHCTLFPDDLDA